MSPAWITGVLSPLMLFFGGNQFIFNHFLNDFTLTEKLWVPVSPCGIQVPQLLTFLSICSSIFPPLSLSLSLQPPLS